MIPRRAPHPRRPRPAAVATVASCLVALGVVLASSSSSSSSSSPPSPLSLSSLVPILAPVRPLVSSPSSVRQLSLSSGDFSISKSGEDPNAESHPTDFFPQRLRRPAPLAPSLSHSRFRVQSSAVPGFEAVEITDAKDKQFLISRDDPERIDLKGQILQLACALDRGQSYNPQRSSAYADRAAMTRELIEKLVEKAPPLPHSMEALDGEWELIYSTVVAQKSSELFFKLHELQTCSFGLSTIGRVAQLIDSQKGVLASEFDTTLWGLTTIPIIGWFKLLPTFGGCVITVAKADYSNDTGTIKMEVDYTTFKPVEGLSGGIPGALMWDRRVPVNAIWQILPWNWGKKPTCSVQLKYLDDNFRVVMDNDGEYFVYARPVSPRPTLSGAI